MATLSIKSMREYLRKSISSLNDNKINGLKAEVELRLYLSSLGYNDRVSPGGWIAREDGPKQFGNHTAVFFPEPIDPKTDYGKGRNLPTPHTGLHTICSTFHQSGVAAFSCAAVVSRKNDPQSLNWKAIELGVPNPTNYQSFPSCLSGMFRPRPRKYNYLRYDATKVTGIPENAVPDEFSKEHLRISFSDQFMSEIVDVDGIFWGKQYTYPIEIKEKTAASSPKCGDYFGLDVGPFTKLAFYAAKKGNLKSLFVVREIDDVNTRHLLNWWFIEFEQLAQFASWQPMGGGTNMKGGGSTVVMIPKKEFRILDENTIGSL